MAHNCTFIRKSFSLHFPQAVFQLEKPKSPCVSDESGEEPISISEHGEAAAAPQLSVVVLVAVLEGIIFLTFRLYWHLL